MERRLMAWHPDLPSAGGFLPALFLLFAARNPIPWELQRKRDLRKKQRGKSRDRWQM
jgi:hypothetical protein